MAVVDGSEMRRVCVVTGGRGFVARHVVSMLLKQQTPGWVVRIADLRPTIVLEPGEESGVLGDALRSGRALYLSIDILDKAQVVRAFKGANTVFHMAASSSSINNYKVHSSVNVQGTKNVIDACVECEVKKLIYTSSSTVVLDGTHGIIDGDESLTYPKKYIDPYAATKAQAESLVLQANGRGGLLTCSIRPSCIFGPGDKLFLPFIIGDGKNMFDFVYVENVAHAHICAEKAMGLGTTIEQQAAGKAFFVTNMEPMVFWEFISLIFEALGYKRPKYRIFTSLIMPIAHIVEWTYKLLAPCGLEIPPFTCARIKHIIFDETFNCTRAKNLLGYSPIVSLKDGLEKTIESFSHLRVQNDDKKKAELKAFCACWRR
ncbi:3beta-hydroxysteroid-dehydrogenase/decarboxylase isoform 1 [Nymphaea thermarum]|nr:3beta-hydroxysteroid-dehydrogenase/decarboxylase isoform 1 [Nymphaea thermarum]